MWACGLLSRIGCPRFNRVTFSKFQTICVIWRIYKPMKCYMKIHTTPLFPFYAHTTSIWTNTYTAYTTVLRPSFYPTCGQHPVSYGVPAVAVGNNGTSVKRSNSLKHDFFQKKSSNNQIIWEVMAKKNRHINDICLWKSSLKQLWHKQKCKTRRHRRKVVYRYMSR